MQLHYMQYGSFAIAHNLLWGLFYIYIRKTRGQQTVTPGPNLVISIGSHIIYIYFPVRGRVSCLDWDDMAYQAENVYYSGPLQKKFTK